MQQVEEVPPPLVINLNGTLLKSEIVEQPIPTPTPISVTESSVAPPSVIPAQLVPVPIAPAQPLSASTPLLTTKRIKRGFRSYLNNKKLNRPLSKPATLLARPTTINTSTILPSTQKPILMTNPLTSVIPKAVSSTLPTNPTPGFTTYLVVDGSQVQFVQVANDGPKPVTFRNQAGQILQATPITVVASANQPVVPSFPINGECSLLSNSSQTITTVRTSSSIDLQQQTTVTSGTTTITEIMPQSTTIINGNSLQTYNNHSSLDESKNSNNNLSLSLSQIAEKVSHRHRRLSSSSASRKKRGRPRLYERDPFTNKPIKSDFEPPTNELTIQHPTLVMPTQTTRTFNTVPTHANTCSSLIFSNQNSQIPVPAPSLLQQHQYSYPSLLNGTSSTNIVLPPTYNPLPTTNFSYSSPTVTKEYTPPPLSSTPVISNPAILSSNSSNHNTNDDVTVHYIDGYVIRESNHPFSLNENVKSKEKSNEQIRCIICQKIDFAQNFFDQVNKYCSNICSFKANEPKTQPKQVLENIIPQPQTQPQQPIDDEPTPLLPDHGLPADPSKWTVSQVGEFVARLTNENIREAFHESEMDGQALLLMTPEHLRETMKIKLGPSLIISSEIAKLRERIKTFSS